ncbi:MAG: Nicotinate dehydrogenase FAD-subunit [Syntrophorhabdaceae bacterium PtaU1.Bin034]|nr:MAG: Nicotinate dehydrogenase FAD-subunit [Syntrophorhabdaceae bacterium PtaU1.Bin034]
MLPRFSSVKANSTEEALSCLAALDDASVLAGGTDLLVRMKKGEAHRNVIDIGGVAELIGVREKDGAISLGACTTHSVLSADPTIATACASLAIACSGVGSPQIRNMGTIGGNLVNASPAADSIAPLLLHNASVTLRSTDGARTEELGKFITAPYKTTISDKEILTSVSIEALRGYAEGYRRVAKRAALAISRLSVAWAIREEEGVFVDARIAIGSCTPLPFRPVDAEAYLNGKVKEKRVAAEAVKMVIEAIRHISGERPSFVYKLPVVRDLLLSVLGGA